MSMLTIDNLNISFPTRSGVISVVKNISFTLERGEMLAVVGESGSGKSLSALSCLRLLPETAIMEGNVRFKDTVLSDASEATLRKVRGSDISMIFQEPMAAFNPLHRIGRQLDEVLRLHQPQMKSRQRLERIHDVLDLVGMGHFKQRLEAFPHQLSGGERQRMMIAMAIANEPDILIADEPTTAVDVTVQAKILETLKELQKKLGMSILFITHDLTLVKRMAERVLVMKDGEIVESGAVSDVFNNPQHSYTKHLLASEPKGSPSLPKTPTQELLSCENLKVYFPIRRGLWRRKVGEVKAVDDVSLALPKATTLGLVGESGSGKSTLGYALIKLLKSEGRIVYLGQEIHQQTPREMKKIRRNMQLVFQDPYASLNPRMTVEQIVAEGLHVHEPKLTYQERSIRVQKVLEEMGLDTAMMERYPHEFSGGQRQRISIARAMVLNPDFIVLDEPTSALDLSVQSQIVALLRSLQEKYGLTYLFISHDLRVVRAVSHRIAVMKQGKIVEQNDTEAIFTRPQQEYTKQLIDAAMIG